MSKKNIAITLSLVVIFILIIIYHKKIQEEPTTLAEWRGYKNADIGIEFQYPSSVKPFFTEDRKSIYFADCKECMGLLNIQTTDIGVTSLNDAFHKYSIHEKLTGKEDISGVPAFMAVPFSEGKPVFGTRVIYLVHNKKLYRIYDRLFAMEEAERFLKTIKFTK